MNAAAKAAPSGAAAGRAKRDDETRLRTRTGRYVAECKYCGCPDGCGCDGEGCGCGTVKAVTK